MSPIDAENSDHAHQDQAAPGFGSFGSAPLQVRFGPYEVDLQKRELSKSGLKLKVPGQSFQILVMLLEQTGQVVSREDLRRALWPSDVFVNFEGSLNSAVQRLRSALQDTSQKPRYIETLPRVGYRFIASIELVAPVSTEIEDGTSTPAPPDVVSPDAAPDGLPELVRPRDGKSRHWGAVAAFFLIALMASYAWYRHSSRFHRQLEIQTQASPAIPPAITRRSVAILGFTNVSGNAYNRWLSTAFTEMLATELAAGDQLRTVAGEHVARAKLELSLPSEDSYTTETLAKIHRDLGCDYVVTGSYVAIGQAENARLRLDARVQDTLTGDTVANVAVAGTRENLFDLASRAGEQLRAKLGVASLTETESENVKASLPSNPEAAKLYSEGLGKLRVYEDVEASHIFEQVIRSEPDYAPAYSALASARRALGYDIEALAAARKALDLAVNMPNQARLQIEARYHEMNQDWTGAAEIYFRLRRSYPDNLDYGLDLASAQLNLGKAAEAAASIAALRNLPPPQRDDPAIDLMEATIAGDLADYKREQTLAESAASKSTAAGARLLLAQAKLVGGSASFFLGNLSGALDADAVARQMFAESGDLDRSAVAAMDIAGVLATQGDVTGAKRSIEQALEVFRKQGDQARLTTALSNLGNMYEIEGDLPTAENSFREALAASAKLNRVRDVETYNLADVLERRGKFQEAKDMLERLLKNLPNQGNKSVLAAATQTLGSIAETQGDMATALRMDQDAVARFKETGSKTDCAGAERSLGRAFLRAGDFVKAKQTFSEALSLDRDTGAKTDTALDQVELAELSLAEAGPIDTGMLRSVIEEFRRQKITDGEIEAEIVLSRESIQEDNLGEADDLLRQATVLSAKSYDPTLRFDVALATAHLQSAQHRFSVARRTIRPALQKAVAIGCVRCQLEARLQSGEIEIQAGSAERGRIQLHQLALDAESRGFNLIAKYAAAGRVPGDRF
jgi:DNA-binding winged helix-turn-helix (wHTH) protein/tetratricopeptide (TPR) repeat protein